jgi:hypothetical protein
MVAACQRPPRAVRIRRLLNSLAIAANVHPSLKSTQTRGKMLSAKASAFFLRLATASGVSRLVSLDGLGFPNLTPRAFADRKASLVRSDISCLTRSVTLQPFVDFIKKFHTTSTILSVDYEP